MPTAGPRPSSTSPCSCRPFAGGMPSWLLHTRISTAGPSDGMSGAMPVAYHEACAPRVRGVGAAALRPAITACKLAGTATGAEGLAAMRSCAHCCCRCLCSAQLHTCCTRAATLLDCAATAVCSVLAACNRVAWSRNCDRCIANRPYRGVARWVMEALILSSTRGRKETLQSSWPCDASHQPLASHGFAQHPRASAIAMKACNPQPH